MIHERFDIQRFQDMFPLDQLRRQARQFVVDRQRQSPEAYPDQQSVERHIKLMEPEGEIITSPRHMAVVEQLREEATRGLELELDRVATDVFVFAEGEPADRKVTKIGGLPYLARTVEWPRNNDDSPMHFVAQICFMDSRFVVEDLPGDVLLVFAGSDPMQSSVESFEFQWVSGRQTNLMSAEDVPPGIAPLEPYYGVLHRSHDYGGETQGIFERYKQSHLLRRIEGTKIGGLPRWIQGDEELPGQFLCTIGSIHPARDCPYPYVNVEKPLGWSRGTHRRQLMWGDVGSVYLFLEGETVYWTVQCY